ncbi:MAG: RNA polymerase sigma factor [Deltaproteobacteria bacterium]
MAAAPPDLSSAEEAEILAGVRAGGAARREASDRLFRKLREPLHSLCMHLTGRRADAEDAVQEVFVAVHQGLPEFRGASRLTTWVYRIALRAAFRARSRRQEGAPVDEGASGGGGEGEMVRRDEFRRVGAAMARLPAEPRAVLSLFAIEGLSHREIADILGIPEGTVWSRLHAARRMLVESLSV